MSAPPALTTHELLLALAGRVDDDLLGIGRELAAIGEDPQAVELLAAALVADRAVLPPWIRDAVVAAARSRHVEIDVEAGLPAAVGEDRTAHRFQADALPAGLITDTVRRVPPRNLAGCTVRLSWRLTPAGAAPGPLPHPVLLVELPGPSTSAEVLAYRLSSVLDRAGMPSSVEVYGAADALPAYHLAALRNARTIVDGGSGRPAPGPPVERGAVAAPVTAPVETVDPAELISSGPLFTAPISAEPVTAVPAGTDAPAPARETAGREAPPLLSGAPVMEPEVPAPSRDQAAPEESRAEETTAIPVAGRPAPASPAAEALPARPHSRAAEAEAASATTPAAGFRRQDAAEVTARFPQRSRASSRPDAPIRAVPDPVPGEAGPTPAAAELPPRSPAIGQLPRLPEELGATADRTGPPPRGGAAPRGFRPPVPGRDEQAEISGAPETGPQTEQAPQVLSSRAPRPAPGPRIGPPLSVVPPAPDGDSARPEPESRADDVDALSGPLDRSLLEPLLEPADESAPAVSPGPALGPGVRESGVREASWAADWASGDWAMPDGGRGPADAPSPAETPADAEPLPRTAEPAVPDPDGSAADDVPADDDHAVDGAEDHGVPDDAPYGRRAAVDGNPTLRPLPGGRRRARHRSDVTDTTPQGLPAPRPVPRLSSRSGGGRPEDAAPRPAEQVDALAAELSEAAPAQDVLFGGSSADDRPAAAGHRADAPDRPRRAAEPDHLFGPLPGSEPEADAGNVDPDASRPGLEGPAGAGPDPGRPDHGDPDHRHDDPRHDDRRDDDHGHDDHHAGDAPGSLGEEHGGEPPAPERPRRRREPEAERPDFDRPAYDRSAFSRPAFGGPPPGEAPGSLFGESPEQPPGTGRSRRSWTGQQGSRPTGRDRVGDVGPGSDTFGGARFGGEEFGGEGFGGDRFGAESPGDRPRNTGPDRAGPAGTGPRDGRPDASGVPAGSAGPGGHADLRTPGSDGPTAEPNGAGPGGHAEVRTPDNQGPAGTGHGEFRRTTPDDPRTEDPAGPGPGEYRRNTPDAPPTDGRDGTPWLADPADTRQDTAPAAPRPAPGEEPSAEALAALSGRERELLRRLQEELASRERPPGRDTGPYPGPSRQGARPQQAHPGPEAGQNGHRNGHAQGHPLGPPDIA
ncbi:MAG: hypothetical protein QOJ30_5831 [Pseudonocardiales bacterium]|nr:hypothetical protein [Pseudonocardiales bacterium]